VPVALAPVFCAFAEFGHSWKCMAAWLGEHMLMVMCFVMFPAWRP
jgi:hypothetical protein